MSFVSNPYAAILLARIERERLQRQLIQEQSNMLLQQLLELQETAGTTSTSNAYPSGESSAILFAGEHDVILGRGSGPSNHIGNIKFRQLVDEYKPKYRSASKSDKPKVAEEVVTVWRNLEPAGRFLARTEPDSAKWYDVGNKRARQKTSQCLREKEREKGDDSSETSTSDCPSLLIQEYDTDASCSKPDRQKRELERNETCGSSKNTDLSAVTETTPNKRRRT